MERSVAVLDLNALASNLAEVRRLSPGQLVIAVVKADGYGHGAVAVSRRLLAEGAEALAVVTLDEAAELRESGIRAEILVLGGVYSREEAERSVALRVQPVLSSADPVEWLVDAAAEAGAGPLPVQVEIDTGMRRMGSEPDHASRLLLQLDRANGIALRGAFTHLACADDPDPEPSREQLRQFASVLDEASRKGVRPPLVHVANSAGIIQGSELAGDMPGAVNAVRPGLMLYGALPASHQASRVDLAPVMSLRSRVVALRPVGAGDSVGYGATWRATGRGRIATVPVGYADGIPWSLGSRGIAGVGGVRVDYAGRVSMDSITLDVGRADVALGDEVVVFGASADRRFVLPVEELADRAGTLSYELLVRVGNRVARVGDADDEYEADAAQAARVDP